jgi:predicted Zn-dependent protease
MRLTQPNVPSDAHPSRQRTGAPCGARPGPRERARRPAALALAALMAFTTVAPPAAAQVNLPSLGEAAAEDFGVGTERRLGDQIMREVRRDPAYLEEPMLLDYLQGLWVPLVQAGRQRGDIGPDIENAFAWEVFLVRDRSVNAFALPGGYVGVHLGLIAMTQTRDELASVLAHELSHVSQRHIARSIANAQRQGMLGLAAMLVGVLLASRSGNADMANAAVAGGQAVSAQGQLNFSRDMEREADRIGFGLMAGAGFAPGGMAAMFDKMDMANRINDNNAFPYLRSHPLTVERVAEARARVLGNGNAGAAGDATLHVLYQAHARVLMDTSAPALRRLQDAPSSGRGATAAAVAAAAASSAASAALAQAPAPAGADRLAVLYGAAYASSILRDHAVAVARADEALRLAQTAGRAQPAVDRALRLMAAHVRLERGERGDASAALALLAPLNGPERAPLILRGQTALALQREGAPEAAAELRRSTEALQTWVSDHRQDAGAWAMLASCASAAGLPLRALRAEAEAAAARGDLNGAIDRLRSAQGLVRNGTQDFIEASVIDSRLRELQALRRQLVAEARGSQR